MEITEWWPQLDADSQAWLIAHNGEAVAPEVLSRITAVSGSIASTQSWVGERGADGFFLSDDAVDWIETTANDESG